MIKKRITEGVFDDVIKRESVAPKGVPRNAEELEFEKSEKGLGELYANDYAKAVLGATEVKEADSIKKELQTLWIDLSRRLDALSNFHFTPKPIVKVMRFPLQHCYQHARAPNTNSFLSPRMRWSLQILRPSRWRK